jgi:hypothetical protein
MLHHHCCYSASAAIAAAPQVEQYRFLPLSVQMSDKKAVREYLYSEILCYYPDDCIRIGQDIQCVIPPAAQPESTSVHIYL